MSKALQERYRELAEKQGDHFMTEEDHKKRAYMYYQPNRDFSGHFEDVKLKKVDDGTFINNGYR